MPDLIVRRRRAPEVMCTEPWTTLEMPGLDGVVNQCGGDWTNGRRGNILDSTLAEIWNGLGFQEARRQMGQGDLSQLCQPICTRLYDGVLHEKQLRIQAGAPAFVQNQLLIAEEIADRKEIVKGLPLHITLCPNSYCNYDCTFCFAHGSTAQRRDMPERVWDELPVFLPTLKTLTLLGGEPLANPRVWEFLTTFDTDRYPDVRLDIFTNGSLLTEKALARIKGGAGEVTISMNAGDAETYQLIERPTVTLPDLMSNVDALMRFREHHAWWFGITLSFIVMRENVHTLIPFGQLALDRNLHIRLVGLLLRGPYGATYDFYKEPEGARHVIGHLDRFAEWARQAGRPDYAQQAVAARNAVMGKATAATGLPAAALVPLGVPSDDPPPRAPPSPEPPPPSAWTRFVRLPRQTWRALRRTGTPTPQRRVATPTDSRRDWRNTRLANLGPQPGVRVDVARRRRRGRRFLVVVFVVRLHAAATLVISGIAVELVVQGLFADAEGLRGPRLVPAEPRERGLDVRAVDVAQALADREPDARVASAVHHVVGQVRLGDQVAFA